MLSDCKRVETSVEENLIHLRRGRKEKKEKQLELGTRAKFVVHTANLIRKVGFLPETRCYETNT